MIQIINANLPYSNFNKGFKSFVLVLFLLIAISTTAQNLGECATFFDTTELYQPSRYFPNTSDTWLYKYRTPEYWIPDKKTPIKTILVNWVICRDDNGGNGWQDSQTFRDEVDRMFENINHVYSTSLPKGYALTCEPQYSHIYDSRIRFELNDIIFIDSTLFNQCEVGQMPVIYSIVDYVHSHYPSSSKALTHIFTQPYNPTNEAWGEYNANNTYYSFVITQGSMWDPTEVVWPDHIAHITHEYGHAVGLGHTYDMERTCLSHFDFLDDVFGECSENIVPCFHQQGSCEDDHVCYLPKDWFLNNFDPPYPIMSGCMRAPRYISPKSMGRMHRALSLYDNRFLVPNETMHKYVKEKFSYLYPLTITSNETWDFAIKMYQDIVVTNNATLTISGEVKMPIDGKIIVHPGSKLVINGGKITSAHDQLWQGIEVWGNNSTHQYETNGSYGQGYLEVRNGATIENAICAVELWRPEHYNTTGGIIHATDATFRNNAKSVHALLYTNYSYINDEQEMPYNSFFHNCSFSIDANYLGTTTFFKHVDMEHVKGISFLGCDFSVNRNVPGVSLWCMGIGAYEAGFTVNSYCENSNVLPCPDEYLIPSSFYGFHRGIHASNDGSAARMFTVRNSLFDNNTCGIYALNTDYATIVDNDFTVGCGSDCDFGIYADGLSAFCIEENTFHPRATNTGSPYGIVIVNSQGTNDIYRNSFANLRCGNVAVGDNKTSTSGLTYTCNTNSGNAIDFCVLKDGSIGDIASSQGSATLPAGNTFDGSLYHLYNDGNHLISYYYDVNEPSQKPVWTLLYGVSANDIQNSNRCLTHYGNGGSVVKSASEKAALESDYLSAHATYSSLLQLYESRIDGGNTPAQVADINNATSSDMWRLRAQLLGLSPYVSGEVLTTAADRDDVFTDPVLFEILAANPDELKKDTLISYLENKDNPLPAYMVDLLRQIASGFTARTALQAQMAQYQHDYSLAAGDIVRSNLDDSIANPTELRTWLGNMGDIASDKMIVASYLQEGDSVHAFALANMLPALYGLQGNALADHADYMRLITLHQTLNRENRNVLGLTEAEALMVDSIATYGTGTSRAMAEAILSEILDDYVMTYSCPTMPDDGDGGDRGIGNATNASMNEAMGFIVSLSPNPATTWTTVDYTLPAKTPKATVTIANTLGVSVLSTELDGSQGQKVLDLRGLADGVYVYTVCCGELIHTGKLVVTK